jgi:hypothetical protein
MRCLIRPDRQRGAKNMEAKQLFQQMIDFNRTVFTKGATNMEARQVFRQMIDFNRTAFNSGFNTMVMLQDNAESVYTKFMQQMPWLPREGEKAVQDWMGTWKKGRDDFKKLMDENFKKAEIYLAEADTAETQSEGITQ